MFCLGLTISLPRHFLPGRFVSKRRQIPMPHHHANGLLTGLYMVIVGTVSHIQAEIKTSPLEQNRTCAIYGIYVVTCMICN